MINDHELDISSKPKLRLGKSESGLERLKRSEETRHLLENQVRRQITGNPEPRTLLRSKYR